MIDSPFNLQDGLIAYGDDKRAARIPLSLAQLGEADINCIMGIVDFVDDESVHAYYWECHHGGDEILCVLEGRLLATIDYDGALEEAAIAKGEAFIVPQASWHRLRVLEPGKLLFFTPGKGSELRSVEEAGVATPERTK